jgi:hypothetical protein
MVEEPVQKYPSMSKWVRAFAVALPIMLVWLCFIAVVLSIPLRSMISPTLAVCATTVALAPLMFWARKYAASHENDRLMIHIVLVAYFLALTLISIRYAVLFGRLNPRDAVGISIATVLIYVVASCLTALSRRVSRR